MSKLKKQNYSTGSGVNGIHTRRSSSPVPSDVSMKSDRSMQIPINYNGKPSLPEKSVQMKRSSSPVPSYVSMKSDRSMQMPINYNGRLSPPEKSFHLRRSSSSVPSSVSLKSDRSMQVPINYQEKPPVPEKSFLLKRSSSSEPSSVSLKSDRSMQVPINYKEKPSPPEKSRVSLKSDRSMQVPINYQEKPSLPEKSFLLKRSSSYDPSSVSLKSDRSMQVPINYQEKPSLPEKSFLLKRSSSYEPSSVSLKSDRSMQVPINYQEKPSLPEKSFLLKRSSSYGPSSVSLKSDRSRQVPINYKEKPSLPEKSNTQWQLRMPRQEETTRKEFIHNSNENSREALHESSTLELPNEKLKFIFRERYQHLFEGTAQRGNPILLNKIYTELYITEDMNNALQGHHEVNHMEATLMTVRVDTPIRCNDIFKPLHGQDKPIRTVLTKGVAGIGKTVSVQKFVLDWAEGEANQDVHFIFPLPFRELNLMRDQKYSLNDLLQHFFMKGIDASSPQFTNHSLLIIFDGLDECRLPLDFQNNESFWDATKTTTVDTLLTNLIKGNLLPSAQIWITSRPAASGRIPPECVDRVTEVRGFNDPQKEDYFRKRITDQSLANRIITHLKSLRSLYIMCHIPVFCWIAATVLERMVVDFGWDKIPKSLTQMYTYFLITQINNKKAKYSDNKVTDKEMIFKLGKLAFEQLEKGNLIFYEEDLKECDIDVREASVYSGVFTEIFKEEFGLFQRKVFSFVHLSIQEHLAALYVFLSFHNHKRNMVNPQQTSNHKPLTMLSLHKTAIDKASESESGHLDLFIRFLVGFSLESNQILLQDLLVQKCNPEEITETISYLKMKIRENLCAHLSVKFFHCLNELNDSSLVDEIQTFLRNRTINKENLSSELWSALVFVILTSNEKLDVFELRKYGTSDKALLCLSSVMKLSRMASLRNCKLTMKSCAALAVLLPTIPVTKELDLSHNNVQDAGVKLLCTGLSADTLNKMPVNCSIAKKKHFLTSALSLNPSFKTDLTLEWDDAAQMIYHLIEVLPQKCGMKEFPGLRGTHCTIEILRLNNCGVTSVGCDFLASVLSSNCSNLKELDLSQNNIGDLGLKVLSDVLRSPSCKLDTLKVNNCKLTEHSCAALASALQENSGLKSLSLSNNELQDSGVKLLAAGLEDPRCKLEALGLSNCNLELQGFASLTLAMRSNLPNLKVLDLGKNRPGDSGVKLLFAVLESPQCRLEKLKLNECGITEESCADLASVFSSEFSCLRELDLSINDLKDSGAKMLSVGVGHPNCKLENLMLYNCRFSEECYSALAKALQSNPSLTKQQCVMDNKHGGSRMQLQSDTG
ncbi:NACHT, LRR and PYD domains-containing protein 12-like isoform X2 [Colossoma macropomum]|uniref:NACHT, LRR and PYD domains-containing protein 12-like isoform X2 n=1 Tax=Colossoma macropomum TaxID=42526 RepID=UPI001864882F|nr:NACHT, LRR and PYD domains-containing protein 12-like isoform X2 [Colossoma macropomum]